MNRASGKRIEKARKAFRRQMILTLAEVADLIDGSIHTARRRLKEWDVLTSYNQSGRYYALPDAPEIIDNLFSRHGLTQKKRHIRSDPQSVGLPEDPAQREKLSRSRPG